MSDPGLEAIEFVRMSMMVDPEWSVQENRGFKWWGHRLRQRVWAEPVLQDAGKNIYRVHARTDFLSGFTGEARAIGALAVLTPFATLSAPVRDPDDPARVQLSLSMYVQHDTVGWAKRLFGLAVALQAAEAERLADVIAEGAGAKVDVSGHPASGARSEPDDMLNVVQDLVAPMGAEESRWAGGKLKSMGHTLRKSNLSVTSEPDAVSASFTLQGVEGHLAAHADQPHPWLGSGLLFVTTLPVKRPLAELGALALEMNERETRTRIQHPCLGSWCPGPEGLSHVSFFPNVVYQPTLTTNLAFYKLNQARWGVRAGLAG